MYQPNNVLITGSAGFIGSAVAIFLTKKYPNTRFVNLDKLDYCSNLDNLDEIKDLPNFKFIKGDICSFDLISYILVEENIDCIINFAAFSHVDASFINSFAFTQNNVFGTHVILEAARKYGKITRLIIVSSDEVFGSQQLEQEAVDETTILNPTSPYSSSKAAADMLAISYIHSFNLPIIITRSNNIYGIRQYVEKVIPKFINQVRLNKKITIHGDGSSLRNFLHLDDVVNAFDTILFNGVIGEIYNIGGSNEKTVLEIAKEVLTNFGHNETDFKNYINFVEDRAFNDFRYHINSDKIKKLGWTEKVSWEEGFKNTFDWYLKNFDRFPNSEVYLEAHPKIY